MHSSFWDLAMQAPGLALLVVIVRSFLSYLRTRDKENAETIRQNNATVKQIAEAHASSHNRTVEALDRNTEMFGRVLVVVEHAEEKLQIKEPLS